MDALLPCLAAWKSMVREQCAAIRTAACPPDAHPDSDVEISDDFADFLDEFGTDDGAIRKRAICDDVDDALDSPLFMPLPHDILIPSTTDDAWAASAAESLLHNGFVVLRLPRPLVSTEECEACSAACQTRLSKLLELARSTGLSKRDVLRFTEVCARTPGGLRFDMRFGHDHKGARDVLPSMPESWSQLTAGVEHYVRAVLQAASETAKVRVDSTGCVVSLPGAPDQHFHPDGTADGLINVFCPLVPVVADNGPTELRPGTHRWCTTPYGNEPSWDERRQSAIAPLLPDAASSLLLFDYRCYHRGLANRSLQPRPVAYVAFAMRDEVSDVHNFPSDVSLVELAA